MAGKEKERKVGGVSAQARGGSAAPARAAGRKVGGVSARMREHREEVPLLGPKAGPISPVHGDFVYNNGAVITCPLIYASFWGNRWLSDAVHLTEAGRLTQFHRPAGERVHERAQPVRRGTRPGQRRVHPASFITNVPTTLTDPDIHTSCITPSATE